MKIDYSNRIMPKSNNYACKDNERLVTGTTDWTEAGPDQFLNYRIYIKKDFQTVAAEIDKFIKFAKIHPELRFLLSPFSLDFAVIGYRAIIPLLVKAWDVENILLDEYCWETIEKDDIEYKDGEISFAGVVKRPVTVSYDVFSNSIRYGVAHSIDQKEPLYFAFHGYPSRNDDNFTVAVVSEAEYNEMKREYELLGSQSNPTAQTFRDKYVENHTSVFEGWDLPDVLWV